VFTRPFLCEAGTFSQRESEVTKTLSMRVYPHEAEQIEVAATAANLKVGPYLYKRVTDAPILSTPELAALAELVCTLRRLETSGGAHREILEGLRDMIGQFCRALLEQAGSR
jgi:hypothetical protein